MPLSTSDELCLRASPCTDERYIHRIQSQFDHLSETYFNNFEYDLGERELGYALSFDHDLEMFAASVGLIKTSVATVLKDKGVWYLSSASFR